jgi:hypothetical protein
VTDAQKDAIVQAVVDWLRCKNPSEACSAYERLRFAAGFCDHPAWEVRDSEYTRDLWRGQICLSCTPRGTPLYEELPRIARLLNEDDAKT